MDKLLTTLLSTAWGKSFIGWTCIASFVSMASIAWAYTDLLKEYQASERRLTDDTKELRQSLQDCWEERYNDMMRFHARQDTIEQITKKKKR